MGPSGSGKTTLLECISLRNRHFEGAVHIDGAPPAGDVFTMSGAFVRSTPVDRQSSPCCSLWQAIHLSLSLSLTHHTHTHDTRTAFVHQKELLFGYMTPLEYLTFNARARMARRYTPKQRQQRVNEVCKYAHVYVMCACSVRRRARSIDRPGEVVWRYEVPACVCDVFDRTW